MDKLVISIACTAEEMDIKSENFIASKFDGYVLKPVNIKDLNMVIYSRIY